MSATQRPWTDQERADLDRAIWAQLARDARARAPQNRDANQEVPDVPMPREPYRESLWEVVLVSVVFGVVCGFIVAGLFS